MILSFIDLAVLIYIFRMSGFEHSKSDAGIIFDIKHFAVHDGPGIRTTIFLKGCPLKCTWCHSPESQNPRPEIAFYSELCIGCGICVEICPNNAQTIEPTKIIRQKCKLVGLCADACYAEALVLHGGEATISELIQEVEKDSILYQTSGGGVTLSGGEPTSQPRFASALLKALQTKGYHTALDTCGHVDWDIFESIINYTDMVLFDLKHMDPVLHESETGVPNWLILSNLRKIAGMNIDTIVRIPVIPHFNATEDNFKVIGRFLESLNIQKIELLPYHNLGVSKYKALGRSYSLNYLESPSLNLLRSYADILEAKGLNVIIEGVD